MASLSIIAAARARLVDMVTDLAGGVQVSYGIPSPDIQQREGFALGPDTTCVVDDPHLKGGRRARYEDWENTLFVWVQSQPDYRLAEARTAELASMVEDMLADDPKLDDLDGLIAATLGEVRYSGGFGPEGPQACVIEMTVRMKARLT